MEEKVLKLLEKLQEVEEALGNNQVFNDKKLYRSLTQQHSYLNEIKKAWEFLQKYQKQLLENEELLEEEKDADFRLVLEEDIGQLHGKIALMENKIQTLLIPPDPNDSANTILEFRAGTGGDEAALFVADCVRMYRLYADNKGWKYETLACSPSDLGGYKEYTMVISGSSVYRFLKHEGGTHRVQRVPATETQGRVHTSAITIAVFMEPVEQEEIQLDEKDLKIDTYRASGAGGQHVNTTDSAVRITHMPSGVVAYCQEEKSQHKNKEKALRLLKARIADQKRMEQEKAISGQRLAQIGTGDRSEKIRTYNFPQNRVTDHRISLTKHNLDQILNGDLEDFTGALVAHFYHLKMNQI